jgi:hypothetical protein
VQIRDEEGVDGYHFLSSHEIDNATMDGIGRGSFRGLRWVTLPGTTGGDGSRLYRDVEARDVLGRVWNPSHQWVEMADSPLFALETECELLRTLTLSLKAKLRSRFATAGLLFIPSEITEAQVSGMTQTHARQVDDVMNYLIQALTRNITNWEDAKAWLPILLRGPGDVGEKIRHIVMDRELLETDIQLRAELIQRILFGLDIQQESVKGNTASNHWNAWNQSEEERRIAVAPDLENLSWALTRLVLYRELSSRGTMPPEMIAQRRLRIDLSAAAVRTNFQEDARQANELGVGNRKAIARATGLNDDEIMVGDEYVQWVGRKVDNPQLMLWGTDEYDQIPWDEVIQQKNDPGPPAETDRGRTSAGPGVGDPGSPNDQNRSGRRVDRPA